MVAAISSLYDLTEGEKPYEIADIQNRFGVCRKTVENWIGNGLAAVKLGDRIFITREALNSFAVPVVKVKRVNTLSARPVAKSEMERRIARQAEAAALK
jgi:hypothetical protein